MSSKTSESTYERAKRGRRTGYTTGACAAAAARAAVRALFTGEIPERVTITLPIGREATFPIAWGERDRDRVVCGVVKDAGDDPDVTHGATIVAEVRVADRPNVVELLGGEGVAKVTRPGLGLEIGGPAINPVPRKNITAMVREELGGEPLGVSVRIHVPGGAELAKRTLNPRLGLLGGISILGTTGIVYPYSTAAFRASVEQAIDVAVHQGIDEIVLTTGGRTERFAMRLLPHLPEVAFIQMGDFVGAALRRAARRGVAKVTIVSMVGKLTKIAAGHRQTHAAGSRVDLGLLADVASGIGAPAEVVGAVASANTGRHALEIVTSTGWVEPFAVELCRRAVAAQAPRLPDGALHAWLVDFEGVLLGAWPPRQDRMRARR